MAGHHFLAQPSRGQRGRSTVPGGMGKPFGVRNTFIQGVENFVPSSLVVLG